ncbi:hypothetical protein [Microbacterium sp. SS28]|uniref:hypothetical protein n=1 Tax=Microbacterium sp. SS28 TaxID=2919948 RepID=UPI001FAA970B|nr:hypothetical protein [Microbacterium sp. SS28]
MSDPSQTPTTRSAPGGAAPQKGGIGLGALIGVGVGVVLLSFVAAFLGARLAGSTDAAPEPTSSVVAPEPTPIPTEEYEAIIEEILPAGSAVRAGQGVPTAGKGYEGDVYINVKTSDVYVFRDGQWVWAGNIRESAAENLSGEPGAAGAAGAQGPAGEQGEQGEQGAAGAAGTQVLLGTGAPDNATCVADGDVYIDTSVSAFYECSAGTWTQSGASAEQLPSP